MARQPRPTPAAERVARALAMVEAALVTPHVYDLGEGDYQPTHVLPLTHSDRKDYELASDCIGAVVHALAVPRRRPGFNEGRHSVVTGYVNTDSAIQDAQHERDLFELVTDRPHPGDLLCWPSIYEGELAADPAKRRRAGKRMRIGHISIIVEVRALEWDWAAPAFDLVDVVQCGSTHRPAIHRSTGASWAGRDLFRRQRRPEWSSVLLRPLA